MNGRRLTHPFRLAVGWAAGRAGVGLAVALLLGTARPAAAYAGEPVVNSADGIAEENDDESTTETEAPTGREAAEHTRLSGDLEQLAERQVWSGVEKKFAELEKLGVALTYPDLMHGAYAARALGDMSSAYSRLKRASKLDSTKEVIDWLYAIDMNYGSVELIATPPRNVELAVEGMPFDPDQRIAVEKATETVKDKGGYVGLLPRGSYVFAGQPFTVEPGLSVRIEVSPKLKKTQGITVQVQTTPTWGSGGAPATTTPPPE